jgi:predicted dehydrogenase
LDKIFNGLEKVTVVAVADPDETGRSEAMNSSGARRGYADYGVMLRKEQPDLVTIAPRQPQGHRTMALAALDIGAHLDMEKPITEFAVHADDIVNTAESNSLKVAVAHHRRYSSVFLELKT